MAKKKLSVEDLCNEAIAFAKVQSEAPQNDMYRTTIPKGVGTMMEREFRAFLSANYDFTPGNSSKGIDFPDIEVDMKATLAKKSQSSCRFGSAEQKIFGLGYHVLVFLYKKRDDNEKETAFIEVVKTVFVHCDQTGDYGLTKLIREHLAAGGNKEDLIGFMRDVKLPLTDVEADTIADRLLRQPPAQGYLGISPAQQWRLRYKKAAEYAGQVNGVLNLV